MEWLEDKATDWVVEGAIENRVPASPVGVTAERLARDEHLKERDFFRGDGPPEGGQAEVSLRAVQVFGDGELDTGVSASAGAAQR